MHKIGIRLPLLLMVVIGGWSVLSAQDNCGNSLQQATASCSWNGWSCSNPNLYIPTGPPYAAFVPATWSCCGHTLSGSFTSSGASECLLAKGYPDFLKKLLQISQQADILVANCDGQFRPFRKPWNLASANRFNPDDAFRANRKLPLE